MIKINVNGKIFEIEEEIIKTHQNSLLSMIIKNNKLFNNLNENNKHEFKNYDSNLFSVVYDYHCNRNFDFNSYNIEEIKEEFLFWNMNENIISDIDYVIFDKYIESDYYLTDITDTKREMINNMHYYYLTDITNTKKIINNVYYKYTNIQIKI